MRWACYSSLNMREQILYGLSSKVLKVYFVQLDYLLCNTESYCSRSNHFRYVFELKGNTNDLQNNLQRILLYFFFSD